MLSEQPPLGGGRAKEQKAKELSGEARIIIVIVCALWHTQLPIHLFAVVVNVAVLLCFVLVGILPARSEAASYTLFCCLADDCAEQGTGGAAWISSGSRKD